MFTLETTATAAYVVAALLFILALAGLCSCGGGGTGPSGGGGGEFGLSAKVDGVDWKPTVAASILHVPARPLLPPPLPQCVRDQKSEVRRTIRLLTSDLMDASASTLRAPCHRDSCRSAPV